MDFTVEVHDAECELAATWCFDQVEHSLFLVVAPWNLGDEGVMEPWLLAEYAFHH